jgi:hypothetical protein
MYAKESKCEFGMTEVLYLGHIIGEKGVQVHQEKITTIMEWPTPKTLTYAHTTINLSNGFLNCVHP